MKKLQEVEVKYPLSNPDDIIRVLDEMGVEKTVNNQYQLDIYYTPPHRNFLDSEIVSEWLRVRKTAKKSSINYKRWLPIGAEVQTHCDEFEVNIEDIQPVAMIFNALDFVEIIRVEKRRTSWIVNSVEVSVDIVEHLGAFLELEAVEKIDEGNIPATLELFKQVVELIKAKVGEQDRRGYPYLIIEMEKAEIDNGF